MSFADEVKISKGALWLIIASVLILNIIVLFTAINWVSRDRQAELNAIQIRELREDQKAANEKLDSIKGMMSEQAVKDAEIKGRDFGYRVGRADKKDGH